MRSTQDGYYRGVPAEGYTGLVVPSWPDLVARVEADATHRHSVIHGEQHWRAVAAAGRLLCRRAPRADRTAVMLFALLHDSMRKDDGGDPQHGKRAAEYIRRLAADGAFSGGQADIERLATAAAFHNDGFVEEMDPTVGCCWDADRLNLWRLSIRPLPRLLCTEGGRDEETIDWATTLHVTAPTWQEVLADGFDPMSVGGAGTPPDLSDSAWFGEEDEYEISGYGRR